MAHIEVYLDYEGVGNNPDWSKYRGVGGRLDDIEIYLFEFNSGDFHKDFYDSIKFVINHRTLFQGRIDGGTVLNMYIEHKGLDGAYLRPKGDTWELSYTPDILRYHETTNYPVLHETRPSWDDLVEKYDREPSVGSHEIWDRANHRWKKYISEK